MCADRDSGIQWAARMEGNSVQKRKFVRLVGNRLQVQQLQNGIESDLLRLHESRSEELQARMIAYAWHHGNTVRSIAMAGSKCSRECLTASNCSLCHESSVRRRVVFVLPDVRHNRPFCLRIANLRSRTCLQTMAATSRTK